ncbi:helix-turn-helix transcriptional regulator [Brevibacillus choshinensis]|uniref:helix-turn-helix domain-containing protein n=1 Tax=Brevibacillus choshinensis TaxID=54911 RepID=UPI002E24A04B|nr:helix-turn-helix transcriptional regulator [Brevibacillus choshinensis]
MTERIGRCRLRSILRSKKISQTELAIMTGLSKQQVNDHVSDRKIMSLETAARVAKVLKCDIRDLYEWVDEDEPRSSE